MLVHDGIIWWFVVVSVHKLQRIQWLVSVL